MEMIFLFAVMSLAAGSLCAEDMAQEFNWDQPAPFQAESKIATLREAQSLALSVLNTAMTVTIDLGEVDCHFKNKQAVGQRLAASALAKDHGMKNVPCQGPIFKAAKFEGSRAVPFWIG